MYGYFSSKVLGINTPAITTSKQIGTTTTGSSKKVATGAAIAGGTNDVSSIVEQTMPAGLLPSLAQVRLQTITVCLEIVSSRNSRAVVPDL